MRRGLAAALLLATGCAGSFEEAKLAGRQELLGASATTAPAPASARCASLDDRHALYGGIGKVTAALAGGTGFSAIPVKNESLQTGLLAGTAVLGAVSVGAVFVSEAAGTSWARECAPK